MVLVLGCLVWAVCWADLGLVRGLGWMALGWGYWDVGWDIFGFGYDG